MMVLSMGLDRVITHQRPFDWAYMLAKLDYLLSGENSAANDFIATPS